MRRWVSVVVMAVLACAVLPSCSSPDRTSPSGRPLPAGVTLQPAVVIVPGVELLRGHADEAFGLSPRAPRPQEATIVRIDLSTPGLSFHTTPSGGPDRPERAGHEVHTTGRSVSQTLRDDPTLRLAINANFFWPCCAPDDGTAPIGETLFGLAVDDGQIVSDPGAPQRKTGGPGCPATTPAVPTTADTGSTVLILDNANHARVTTLTAADPIPRDVRIAVAGGPQPEVAADAGCGAGDDYPPLRHVPGPSLLLRGGHGEATASATPPEHIAARTFAGVSSDGRTLFLGTIDGGETSGAAFADEAAWLQLVGASDGMNLDGGGSTAMALDVTALDHPPASPCPGDGRVVLLNVPYGFVRDGHEVRCGERLVGNALAVSTAFGGSVNGVTRT